MCPTDHRESAGRAGNQVAQALRSERLFRASCCTPRSTTWSPRGASRREIRTDPYNVFRYEGRERGPTQHETAIGPSLLFVNRAFERLAEVVPEIANCGATVVKAADKAIAPAFRLQHPLPFGAAGDTTYDGTRKDLERGIYRVAMYAATGGDPSRSWRYDCGLFIFYSLQRPRALLGAELFDAWPDAARTHLGIRTRVDYCLMKTVWLCLALNFRHTPVP